MASWAYACHSPETPREPWYAACSAIDTMPVGTEIVRVRVGARWHCARVDRNQRIAVDGAAMRDIVASDPEDCPDCDSPVTTPDVHESANALEGPATVGIPLVEPPRAASVASRAGSSREVNAAAMSLQGRQFVVILVAINLVRSHGEADMAITDLRRRFGGADVVLMGQREDGTPEYHGEPDILGLLSLVPVDRMPWRVYPLG